MLLEKGITLRGIVPDHPSLKVWREERDQKYGHMVKIVPFEAYSATNSIDVGDTFVRIIGFRDLQAVIIDNPDVALSVRQIFEMLWRSLPDSKLEENS
ncbi:MAG: hypothetical protein AAB288_07605 [Acidobacteriota bacterium]